MSRPRASRYSCSSPRPQLAFDQFLAQFAEAALNVVAVERQIAAVIAHAANQQMNMVVVGVVMIDRDPLELGAEVPLHPGHKVARVLPQIDAARRLPAR